MAEYTKMKNAELEALLKERNLPHTGKKADLIKRLQESDAEAASGSAPAAAPKADEEIDWDDEPATAATNEASKATTEPAAAAMAAGGRGQPANPQAVPNQKADIDPSKTNDLTVASDPTTDASSTAQTTGIAAADTTSDAPTQPQEKEKTPVDYSIGLATANLDEEIEKRRKRAAKFGTNLENDETFKALERAKKFGTSELPGKLNEALPERRERKRPAPAAAADEPAQKKRPGHGGRNGSRRGNGGRSNTPQGGNPKKENGKAKPVGMSAEDKAKIEARKAKFAAPSS